MLWHARDANTTGDSILLSRLRGFVILPNALSNSYCFVGRVIRQQNNYLIATISVGFTFTFDSASYEHKQLHESFITNLMAVVIVHLLKKVRINFDDCQRLAIALAVQNQLLNVF